MVAMVLLWLTGCIENPEAFSADSTSTDTENPHLPDDAGLGDADTDISPYDADADMAEDVIDAGSDTDLADPDAPQDDPNHCGESGDVCRSGKCEDGQCQPFDCDPAGIPFGGGSGYPSDPFTLCSAEQLVRIADEASYGFHHFALSSDIDLEELGAGTQFPSIENYFASFDGFGFTIRNVEFTVHSAAGGLFLVIHPSASVSNLRLENISATNTYNGENNRIGGLTGTNFGALNNIDVQGTIQGFNAVGGVVGVNAGLLKDVSVDATVNGQGWGTGAIAGFNHGDIIGVESDGDVTSKAGAVGGLVGQAFVNSAIIDSTARATVNCTGTDSNWHGRAGGLVGVNEAAEISNSAAHGEVKNTQPFTGGLVGLAQQDGVIDHCHATNPVSSTSSRVGGLVGSLEYDSEIRDSYATGEVAADGAMAGGLVGKLRHQARVSRSFATGDVEGSSQVGGLIGRVREDDAGVEDCYATGDITAAVDAMGGLVGRLSGRVDRCYSTGAVAADPDNPTHGGLIGHIHASEDTNAQVADSYWDEMTSQTTTSAGGEGLATEQFATTSNFEGWSFSDVWLIPDASGIGDAPERPRLQWEFK